MLFNSQVLNYCTGADVRDTNSEGQQAFLIIGDSIAQGVGEAYGPTPSAGTVYEYDSGGNQIVEVGSEDMLVHNGLDVGSPWPRCGIDYNSASGKKPVFIHRGFGSSTVYTNTGDANNTWRPSNPNSHYQDAVDDANACMALLKVTKLKAIFVVLGINDAAQASTITDVRTAWIALIDQLIIDFPNTDIVLCQNGRSYLETVVSVALTTSRMALIRGYVKEMSKLYSNVHLCGNLTSFVGNSYYKVDNIHPNQAGNNALGSMFARWLSNSSYNKIARSIISSHFDELSSTRKSLINTFAESIGETNFHALKCLLNFKTTIKGNVFLDWAFMSNPLDLGFTHTANDSISVDTTSKSLNSGYVPSLFDAADDVFEALKIKINSIAAGVAAFCAGSQDQPVPTTNISFRQTAGSAVASFNNDLTSLIYEADSKLQDDTDYLWGRVSDDTYIHKDGTQVDTGNVSVVSAVPRACVIGGYYANTSLTRSWTGSCLNFRAGKLSAIDNSVIHSAMETLQDNW